MSRREFFTALGILAFEPSSRIDRQMIDLRGEPEILDEHRKLPQILDAGNYVENVFIAVGYSSRCWKDEVFDTTSAIRVANELCAMIRLHKEGKFP